MLNMPVPEIKQKIQEQANLSASEVDAKIQDKMKQLSGLISEEGACHIVANELNVKLMPEAKDRKIGDLVAGLRDVDQDVRVINTYEVRTFESKFGGEGKVGSFLAGDDSGICRVTCWGEKADTIPKLSKGDIVRVKSGYTKENNGRIELHCNNNSTLTINPPGVEVGAAPDRGNEEYVRKSIGDLTRGDYRVEILGTIVQVYDPKFFERKDGSGESCVINMLVDDGTGNARLAFWGDEAAKLLSTTLDNMLAKKDATYEDEKTELLGTIVSVQGRAKLNATYNSIEINADSMNLNPDADKELERAQSQSPQAVEPATPTEPEPAVEEKAAEPVAEPAAEEPVAEKKVEEEAVSLDDIEAVDEVDFDDLESV